MVRDRVPVLAEECGIAQPVAMRVSELSAIIAGLLDSRELQDILVQGEVTNYKRHSSGHVYFSLGEKKGSEGMMINCVMWRSHAQRLSFEPEDGMHVQAFGSVGHYAPQGKYQFYVQGLRHAGAGEKHLLVERWKRELEELGCFAPERKKTLPAFPCRIGIVTSETGAVLQDIRNIITRRYPTELLISPTAVQGDGAHNGIAEAIRRIDGMVDVIIVARGGGSFEDLFPFNHPDVVQAITACRTPVVSAVGHEVDFTLCDLAADVRAPTPSAAAELVVPDRSALFDEIMKYRGRINGALGNALERARQDLTGVADRLHPRRMERRNAERREYIDDLSERLARAAATRVSQERLRLSEIRTGLEGCSPLHLLARGYCVAEKGGRVVRSVCEMEAGDRLVIRVADGRSDARVEKVYHDTKI
jgi:exodeoxyribonuclease VII large subunit